MLGLFGESKLPDSVIDYYIKRRYDFLDQYILNQTAAPSSSGLEGFNFHLKSVISYENLYIYLKENYPAVVKHFAIQWFL